MMADVRASYCVMPSLLTRPIVEGEVAPKGLALEMHKPESIDVNSRRMLNVDFDIGEMAISTFAKAFDLGIPLVALPVFTSGRRFLQPGFQLRANAGIGSLSELRGRTVAMPQYWMSNSIWQRQILAETFGVAAQDMDWVTFQPERMDALRVPQGIEHRLETSGRSPHRVAEAGEIDAYMTPGGGNQNPEGEPRSLVPAFPQRREAQRDYYEQTGIFPIMHVTVIRKDLIEREPWIAESLMDAYQQAKVLARSRQGPTDSESPASGEITKELVDLMGIDPWTFGIAANRKALDAFVKTAFDQKLVDRPYQVEELFAPSPDPS